MKKKEYINYEKLPSFTMPMELDVCRTSEYMSVLELVFHDEKFERLVEHRNKMFKVAERPGANPFAIRKGIEQDDQRIAMMILTAMQRQTLHHTEKQDIKINDLWKKIPADDEHKQKVKQLCSYHLNMITFLSDIVESKLMDIQQELKELFPQDEYDFTQFDGVATALHQLSSAFRHTRSTGSEEQQALFADYAESMENYFDKRMKTFIAKSEQLRKKADAAKREKRKK